MSNSNPIENSVEENENLYEEKVKQAIKGFIAKALPSYAANLSQEDIHQFIDSIEILFTEEQLKESGVKVYGMGLFPLTNKILKELGLPEIFDLPVKYTSLSPAFVEKREGCLSNGLPKLLLYIDLYGSNKSSQISIERIMAHEIQHILDYMGSERSKMDNYLTKSKVVNYFQEIASYLAASWLCLKYESWELGVISFTFSIFTFEIIKLSLYSLASHEKNADNSHELAYLLGQLLAELNCDREA